jgi:hypothetical protein
LKSQDVKNKSIHNNWVIDSNDSEHHCYWAGIRID